MSAASAVPRPVSQTTRSRLLTAYIAAVVLTGAGLLPMGIPRAEFRQPLLFVALLLGSMTAAVMKIHLPLSSGQATLSMSYFTDFLSLVLLGPHEAMLVAGASAATQSMTMRRNGISVRQTLFSSATLIITVQAAGLVASRLGGFDLTASFTAISKPAAGGAATFFLCNSWLVATVVALSRGRWISATWREDFLWAGPACFVAAGAATFAAAAMSTQEVWLVLFAAALLGLTFHSYRVYLGRVSEHQEHLRIVSNLHLATVEALARAIDARDQTIDPESGAAENHIRRVEARAAALGEAAGMTRDEVEGLKIAALLHDIGKLAVPEHILTKPGRLTPAEFDYIRLHPTVGANILKRCRFPIPLRPTSRAITSAGMAPGYPDGLEGRDDPARRASAGSGGLLRRADRQPPLSPGDAPGRSDRDLAARGRQGAGPAADRAVHGRPAADGGQRIRRRPRAGAARIVVRAPDRRTGDRFLHTPSESPFAAATTVYQSISQATQEVRALYDIAQTLGTRLSVDDTMGLLTSKVNRLVPASCWAL